ncbi:hypothetical protein ACFVVM_08535 [Nocardia sp. NPDC058176]|uniref:hypothetical protein n=1 Tax=Nocardia sp. NPDC058176 TaxID=3346368 RepID=UPI0036DC5628
MDARAHQSVHFAVDDRTASVTVIPEVDGVIDVGRTAEILRSAHERGHPFDVVALGASTYDGQRLDCSMVLPELASADPRVRFVLDDAWCAIHCFSSGSMYPGPLAALPALRSLGYGNPVIVTQSAHKTMLALRQGAYIHVDSGAEFEIEKRLRSSIFRYHTTSPSWLILASLDIARAHAVCDGDLSIQRSLGLIQRLSDGLERRTPGRFQVLAADAKYPYRTDALRVHIRVPPGGDAVAIRETLWGEHGIHIPRVQGDRLVASVTIGASEDAIDRLVAALSELTVPTAVAPRARRPVESEFDGFLIAYPPGVPLRLPYSGRGAAMADDIEDEVTNGAEIFEIASSWQPRPTSVAPREM